MAIRSINVPFISLYKERKERNAFIPSNLSSQTSLKPHIVQRKKAGRLRRTYPGCSEHEKSRAENKPSLPDVRTSQHCPPPVVCLPPGSHGSVL